MAERESSPPFSLPQVHVLERMPTTASGKVIKTLLRQHLAAGGGALLSAPNGVAGQQRHIPVSSSPPQSVRSNVHWTSSPSFSLDQAVQAVHSALRRRVPIVHQGVASGPDDGSTYVLPLEPHKCMVEQVRGGCYCQGLDTCIYAIIGITRGHPQREIRLSQPSPSVYHKFELIPA